MFAVKVPEHLKERVYEIDRFDEGGYVVNLEDGWYVGYEGLHICQTKKEVIEVLEEAEFKGLDFEG